jgi:type II secretory pathway component PulM
MNFSLDKLTERERRMVTFGGIAAVVLLIGGVILPLESSVTKVQQRIDQKQADLAWMRNVAPELANSGPMVAQPTSPDSLLVVIDRAARESGLGGALTNSEPQGQGKLRVRLEKAQFDILVGWLARLSEQHGIGVESATVDNAGAPGVVNAGLVLQIK